MATTNTHPKVADVLRDIGSDVATIASDQLELTRRELGDYMERLIIKASVSLLGATVALVGLGMLCMVVVLLLEPVIAALWLRLLLMAVVYIALGATAAYVWFKRMTALRGPDLERPLAEVKDTVRAVGNGLD